MTEQEWLTSQNSIFILWFLHMERQKFDSFKSDVFRWRKKKRILVSDRKMQRLLLAYCNRLSCHFDEQYLRTLELAESFTEGDVQSQRMDEYASWCLGADLRHSLGYWISKAFINPQSKYSVYDESCVAHTIHDMINASFNSLPFEQRIGKLESFFFPEKCVIANLIRDIIGNPFRPITLNPSWLTSTVVALATSIFHDKAFDQMPILADALQDAGCDHQDILNHCRHAGEHVRGCWVVDLLLGKE